MSGSALLGMARALDATYKALGERTETTMGSQHDANEQAYSDGHAVRRDGKGLAFNPYPAGTGLAAHWQDGWRAADQAIDAGVPMNSKQLDDQAAEARDEATDRTEALDQRDADLAGKIEALEAERDELQARATAAMNELGLVPMPMAEESGRIVELETELRLSKEETASMAKVSSQCNLALNKQLANANGQIEALMRHRDKLDLQLTSAAELVSKVEDERDALRDVLRDVLGEVCGQTKHAMIACQTTVMKINEALRPKGETDGDDTGM